MKSCSESLSTSGAFFLYKLDTQYYQRVSVRRSVHEKKSGKLRVSRKLGDGAVNDTQPPYAQINNFKNISH